MAGALQMITTGADIGAQTLSTDAPILSTGAPIPSAGAHIPRRDDARLILDTN
jgi:hypothetical protein